MSENFGAGVSRTLTADGYQYELVVWQKDKPPLDSELNLGGQIRQEKQGGVLKSQMPSGWVIDPFNSDRDFQFDPTWSNFFKLGRPSSSDEAPVLWASVNGWMIPVTGSQVSDGDTSNRINLFQPPTSDVRWDFVFLEVWRAQVAPNPSTVNKPSASTLYKYGNVLFGGTNLVDQITDPTIGFQTTQRVQIQYRLRLVGSGSGLGTSIDFSTYTEGMDDPNVLAQGASTSPQAGFTFTNMRSVLGDSGLWRAGDGDYTNDLGTVDGYVYAIPVCAIRRRNTASFVARTSSGNANQMGALDRNPNTATITDPVEATRTFGEVTLTSAIDETATGAIQVDNLSGSGFDNTDLNWDSVFLKLDDEIIRIESVDTSVTPGTITIRASGGRGRGGTQASPHDAGTTLEFYNFRPDGRFADEVYADDVMDLRHAVSPAWDYQAILAHNLGKLFNNTLRSSYKQGAGTDTEGTAVLEVDTLYANGAFSVPNQTEALDGPDGIRTVFSDAATIELATLILNPETGSGGTPTAVADFTAGAGSWEPAADFDPSGFQSDGGGWTNGTVIELNIGGSTLDGGARATVRDTSSNRWCRYLTPREYWLTRDEIASTAAVGVSGAQAPFQLRFIQEGWGDPVGADESAAAHPGPLFPLPEYNFERPFLVLGGVVNEDLRTTSATTVAAGSVPSGLSQVRFTGVDFDTAGNWFPSGDLDSLSTTGITNLLLYGERNLFDMLTNGGQDRSGASSELYLVLTGDTSNAANAGVFRVVGAGTAGYTTESAATADALVVERVGEGVAALVATAGLTAEVRSQYTHTQDGDSAGIGASAVLVLTDLESVAGGASSPWDGLISTPSTSQAVLDTLIQYGPSRGGTARVGRQINRVAMVGADSAELVREAVTALDPDFDSEAGVPDGEIYFPLQPIQTWNRLPSLGLGAPRAPAYGDGVGPGGEVLREAPILTDVGSKTLVIRPYQRVDITLNRYQATAGATNRFFPSTYSSGPFTGDVDGGNLFPATADYAYAFPWEYMPKFGRQDIPYHQTDGTVQTVYPGINHVFGDSQTDSDDVFRVVGGVDSGSGVVSLFIQTGSTSGRDYGEYYSMGGSSAGYQGRIYEDVTVYSSDITQKGLKGIQLPPFLGIARLYGVYDLREFAGLGAWDSDRVTKSTALGRPANLLREDVDLQSLFIVKGGASDVTDNEDDHTYVIPQDIIDVRRSGQYVAGETFDDLEFVVECVVFGFARGFINKNNFVLARNNLPDGGSGTGVAALATQVSTILPLALPFNEQLYVTYDRVVYQGDPYMTRDGATKTTSDYETRLGQIPASGAAQLATPIQQFDSTDNYSQVPEIPNARALEILASMDFYTTLGTGKIGGKVYPGTLTDIGHITNAGSAPTRVPAATTDPIWQTDARTFTQPLPDSVAQGWAEIRVLQDSVTSAGESVLVERGTATATLVSNTDFSGGSAAAVASSLAAAINASVVAVNQGRVRAVWPGDNSVRVYSLLPGGEGALTKVRLTPAAGNRVVAGFSITPRAGQSLLNAITDSALITEAPVPKMNGSLNSDAQTALRLTGLTERLPLGILLQDSDFIGEDALRNGASLLQVWNSGGSGSGREVSPLSGTVEYGRIQASTEIGMADGSILQYTPYTLSTPTGVKSFRLYRGGGSSYDLLPTPAGGPLDWTAGGFDEGAEPVLKGAVLAGRAFLVRNYPETAYSGNVQRTYGDELQMVIITQGVVGHGPQCGEGCALDGQISPTGHGEGFAASDRYRLEGKPLFPQRSREGSDPNVPLAPYDPTEDESNPDPCA
jgi:hypothetical protein